MKSYWKWLLCLSIGLWANGCSDDSTLQMPTPPDESGTQPGDNPSTGENPPGDPDDPEPDDPEPDDPEPVDPEPVDPEPVDPEPVDPEPVDPEPVDPEPVDPEPVDPEPVDPEPVDPEPVDPEPVDPEPVLEGCADPANDGAACAYSGAVPECAKAVCKDLVCTLVPVDAGKVCRSAAGVCDIQETCDGSSMDCPTDAKQPTTVVCRQSAGACDIQETCDGLSNDCPADKKQPNSYVCSKKSGSCDVDVKCDGSGDACPAKTLTVKTSCACPKRDGGPKEASKMLGIDYGGYLLRSRHWSAYGEYIDTLKKSLSAVSIDSLNYNRQMQKITSDLAKSYKSTKETGQSSNYLMTSFSSWPGYQKGWYWKDDDVKTGNWVPQGMTVGESNGFKVAIVGWHYTDNKRTRISIININDLSGEPKYRHVLLVQPNKDGSFTNVQNHIGGLALVWPYLYEADSASSKGLRVFDMRNILQVSTDDACDSVLGKSGKKFCAYGYKYILPQAGSYYSNADSIGTNDSCKITFSFISYDEGEGPHILAGEYVKDEFHGRMVRWPLAGSGKLKTIKAKATDGSEINVAQPDGAWYSGERNLQGAISTKANGTLQFLLTSTRNGGALRRTNPDKLGKLLKASDNKWSYRPEGIAITGNQLWIATEGNENPRAVYYSDLNTVLSL